MVVTVRTVVCLECGRMERRTGPLAPGSDCPRCQGLLAPVERYQGLRTCGVCGDRRTWWQTAVAWCRPMPWKDAGPAGTPVCLRCAATMRSARSFSARDPWGHAPTLALIPSQAPDEELQGAPVAFDHGSNDEEDAGREAMLALVRRAVAWSREQTAARAEHARKVAEAAERVRVQRWSRIADVALAADEHLTRVTWVLRDLDDRIPLGPSFRRFINGKVCCSRETAAGVLFELGRRRLPYELRFPRGRHGGYPTSPTAAGEIGRAHV